MLKKSEQESRYCQNSKMHLIDYHVGSILPLHRVRH